MRKRKRRKEEEEENARVNGRKLRNMKSVKKQEEGRQLNVCIGCRGSYERREKQQSERRKRKRG